MKKYTFIKIFFNFRGTPEKTLPFSFINVILIILLAIHNSENNEDINLVFLHCGFCIYIVQFPLKFRRKIIKKNNFSNNALQRGTQKSQQHSYYFVLIRKPSSVKRAS